MLDYPALIGRAYWAEAQFDWFKSQPVNIPLIIYVTNEHQFYAMGIKGLAWHLNIAENQILLSDKCVYGKNQIFFQNKSGNFYRKVCIQKL